MSESKLAASVHVTAIPIGGLRDDERRELLCLLWTPPRRNFLELPAWPTLMWIGSIAPIGGAEMLVGEALVEGCQFHQRPWWSKTGVSQAACLAEFWKAPATVGESFSDCLRVQQGSLHSAVPPSPSAPSTLLATCPVCL